MSQMLSAQKTLPSDGSPAPPLSQMPQVAPSVAQHEQAAQQHPGRAHGKLAEWMVSNGSMPVEQQEESTLRLDADERLFGEFGAKRERSLAAAKLVKKERVKKERARKEGVKREGVRKEGAKKEGIKKEGVNKEGANTEGVRKEGAKKEGVKKEGLKKAAVKKAAVQVEGGALPLGGELIDSSAMAQMISAQMQSTKIDGVQKARRRNVGEGEGRAPVEPRKRSKKESANPPVLAADGVTFIYPCGKCEKTFESRAALSGHTRFCSGGNWRCEWCKCKETETPCKVCATAQRCSDAVHL